VMPSAQAPSSAVRVRPRSSAIRGVVTIDIGDADAIAGFGAPSSWRCSPSRTLTLRCALRITVIDPASEKGAREAQETAHAPRAAGRCRNRTTVSDTGRRAGVPMGTSAPCGDQRAVRGPARRAGTSAPCGDQRAVRGPAPLRSDLTARTARAWHCPQAAARYARPRSRRRRASSRAIRRSSALNHAATRSRTGTTSSSSPPAHITTPAMRWSRSAEGPHARSSVA
jgi:hypothetical protein